MSNRLALPDGCMDLLWNGRELAIAGADTHAKVFTSAPGSRMTGLRFAPGDAPRVLGAPADAFTNERVPLADVWSPARVHEITDRLAAAGCNSTTIADRVGLSTRHLQRRSVAAFGYGAKTLGRVLRMQQALALVRRGTRPAESAAHAGYADQSHLARDVKEMAGVPLGTLLG